MKNNKKSNSNRISIITIIITLFSVASFYGLSFLLPDHDSIVLFIGVLLILSSIAVVGHRVYLIYQILKTVRISSQ